MNRKLGSSFWARLLAIALAVMILAPTLPVLAEVAAPGDIKFSGVITTVPVAADDPWQIGGQTLLVDAATRVRLTTAPAAEGMWAEVMARRLAEGGLLALQIVVLPPEVRLKGPVAARPDDGIGAWTIAGQIIQVTADTAISQRGGATDIGQWVEVYAQEAPTGGLTATRLRGVEPQEVVELFGAIQGAAEALWSISGVPVTVNTETLIPDEPQAGLLAHVVATLQDDATLLGRIIKVTWQITGGLRPPIQFTGAVEALPADGLVGVWQIEGRTVLVTPATQIVQIKGLVEVGARVHVVGWQEPERVTAMNIVVLASPSGAGRPFSQIGLIEALPQGGLIGTWTIGGEQIQVTRQTRISGAAQIRIGAPVEVGGLQYQNGVKQATWLRIREMGGPGPHPTRTPRPTTAEPNG